MAPLVEMVSRPPVPGGAKVAMLQYILDCVNQSIHQSMLSFLRVKVRVRVRALI